MRRGALIGCAAVAILGACQHPEPTVVYRTQEVLVEVTKPCEHPRVTPVEGPDLAPRGSNYYEVVQYLVARIYALRSWSERLQESIKACEGSEHG